MKERSKIMYLLLVISLVLNLVLPASMVIASDELEGPMNPTQESVIGETSEGNLGMSVTKSVYEITDNLITNVVVSDKDGNNIEKEDIRPDQGSRVRIDYNWELPKGHGYLAGSTFTFNLPDKFKGAAAIEDVLTGGVGTLEMTSGGQVTFTFNEEIEDSFVPNGTFFVWREFDSSKISGSTKQEIVFPIKDNSDNTILVHFQSKANKEIEKSGKSNKGMNASEINWVVDFNKGEKKINNAVFTDKLPSGLTIDLSSIKVHKLDVQLDGSVKERQELNPGEYTPQINADGFVILFPNIDSAYRVKYTTLITSTIDEDKTYTNKVTISGDNLTLPVGEADVPVKYSKPLDKVSTDYVSSTQTITWKIQYNYNEKAIGKDDAWLIDTFGGTQKLANKPFEVYEMTINDDGKASRTTGTPLTLNTDYTIDNASVIDGFKLTFQNVNGINAAYEVIYSTTSKDRVHADPNITITNKVEMHNTSTSADREIKQVIFNKGVGTVDYNAKKIQWKINLNDDKYTMNNVVITDSFVGQWLTFLPDTLEITGLTKGVDYKVEATPSNEEGFTITFLKPIVNNHLITYETKFDPTKNTNKYKNEALLKWEEVVNGTTKNYSITKSAEVIPGDYTKKNGEKTATYDAQKKEITWIINVNYNLYKINKAVIQDFYTDVQSFDKDLLEVHHLNLEVGSDNVTVGALVKKGEYTVDIKKDVNGNDGFELKFNNPIDSAYRITYKTSLEGHPVKASYKNKATLTDETSGEVLFDQSFIRSIPNGGEYIIKTGIQDPGANEDLAFWTLNINRSQSHVDAGAILKDSLSSNQILVKDSFKLYETKVTPDGVLTAAGLINLDSADYTLVVNGNSFILTFNNPLEKSYILKYTSFVNADHGEKISNKAEFTAQSSGTIVVPWDKEIMVRLSGGGGSGSVPVGDLTIVKVDLKDNKVKLEGATFGLFDKSGNHLLATGVTDGEGKAIFKGLKFKKYMLRELDAPVGYLFDVDYKAGKLITFDGTHNTIHVANEKGIWDFELTKVDKEDLTKVLKGAHFTLQLKNNNGVYVNVPEYSDMVTLTDGTISYKDLVKGGEYQLVEIASPKGYKLDQSSYKFTIDQNQTSTKKVTIKNEINVGSVELLKTDEYNGAALKDVEFDLQDKYGAALISGLKTDQYGKLSVPNLKAGEYQFVEVTALPDYDLDSTPVKFEIVDDGVTVNVTVENKLTSGSVKLTKTEADHPGIKLQGAKFSILDVTKKLVVGKDGKELKDLTTDKAGEIIVTDLRPGKYYFEETVAPSGYFIKSKLTEFEIIKNKETLVIVENYRYVGGGGGGITPVDPTPIVPVDPTPITPVDPKPGEPVDPTPGTPIDPKPVKPVIPDEKVVTTKETPVKGKVEVPKDTTPKISKQPKNGKVTVDPKGNWVYKPKKDYVGKDSFTIIVTDKDGNEEEVLVEVDVNDIPRGGTDGISENTGKTHSQNTLPQTGESSHLPLQLTGFGFIILGALLLFFRKKQLQRK